jgi:hypothetical protein
MKFKFIDRGHLVDFGEVEIHNFYKYRDDLHDLHIIIFIYCGFAVSLGYDINRPDDPLIFEVYVGIDTPTNKLNFVNLKVDRPSFKLFQEVFEREVAQKYVREL